MSGIQLLPGLEDRPWLAEAEGYGPRFGNERRNPRGRVRVTLGKGHPYANSAGWCWRYRLAVSYALGQVLRSDEHVDHINGTVDDDRLENLRILNPEVHGRYHARLFELAGCRGPDGRFREFDSTEVETLPAYRVGPVISSRGVDASTWLPLSQTLETRTE